MGILHTSGGPVCLYNTKLIILVRLKERNISAGDQSQKHMQKIIPGNKKKRKALEGAIHTRAWSWECARYCSGQQKHTSNKKEKIPALLGLTFKWE